MVNFQIAIDGPVAAGKGTVSKKLAERLGFLYVDTGATYRVATLLAMRNGFDFGRLEENEPGDVDELAKLINDSSIEMRVPRNGERDGRMITVLVGGEDVSWAIREEAVSAKVYIVARLKDVREVLVRKQQEIAADSDVVMEGRDIAYKVLPGAQLKIYLDARPEVRLARRIAQLNSQGITADKKEVERELQKRDEADINRQVDPLRKVEDAWHFDASDLTIDETVEEIVNRVEELRKSLN